MSPTKSEGENNEPWKEMSLQELEKEYSPSKWSKRYSAEEIIDVHVKTATESTKATREAIPNRLDITYGLRPRMKLDVFGEDLPKEGCVFVYVHGGYWQDMNKDISSYVVQPLYKYGIVTVIVGYDLAPQVKMEEIVSEVRTAIIWACDLARQRGSKGVVLSGHSAGGHLITEVLSTTGESEAEDLAKYRDLITGAVLISGVFDLRPLVKTYVNKPLELTESSSWSLSPMGKINTLAKLWPSGKLLIAVGQHDSPEFQRQSKQYFKGCSEAGLRTNYMQVEADHFNIVEDLAKNDFSLTLKIIEFVKSSVTCNEK